MGPKLVWIFLRREKSLAVVEFRFYNKINILSSFVYDIYPGCPAVTFYRLLCTALCTFKRHTHIVWGTAVAQWLKCCATNRKVADSIPDVMGIFH